MSIVDEINYAHDLVARCNKVDLPHKMEAHNAIDRIEAAHKAEVAGLGASNAKMRDALSQIAYGHGRAAAHKDSDLPLVHLLIDIASDALCADAEGGTK